MPLHEGQVSWCLSACPLSGGEQYLRPVDEGSGVGGEALGCSAVYGFLARRIQSPVPPAEAAVPVFNASAARASSVAASGRDEVLMLSRLE
jgi:hypothetical protein